MSVPIDLYTLPFYNGGPNGIKISIALEELNLPYQTHGIDISKNEQFAPDFLKISPNNKIPAIVDHNGPEGKDFALFESGAILIVCFLITILTSSTWQRRLANCYQQIQLKNIKPISGYSGKSEDLVQVCYQL